MWVPIATSNVMSPAAPDTEPLPLLDSQASPSQGGQTRPQTAPGLQRLTTDPPHTPFFSSYNSAASPARLSHVSPSPTPWSQSKPPSPPDCCHNLLAFFPYFQPAAQCLLKQIDPQLSSDSKPSSDLPLDLEYNPSSSCGWWGPLWTDLSALVPPAPCPPRSSHAGFFPPEDKLFPVFSLPGSLLDFAPNPHCLMADNFNTQVLSISGKGLYVGDPPPAFPMAACQLCQLQRTRHLRSRFLLSQLLNQRLLS